MSSRRDPWQPHTDTVSRLEGRIRCGFHHKTAGHPRTRRRGPVDEFQISYLMVGEAWYQGAEQKSRILPGMVFMHVPGERHDVVYNTDTAMFHFSVVLPSGTYHTLKDIGALDPDRPVFAVGLHPGLVAEVEQIITALRHEPDSKLHRVVVRMQAFVSRLLDLDETATPQRSRIAEEASVRLSRDFSAPIPLPDLAADLGLSYSAFRKLFLQETGISPGAYRIQRRLDYASDLLVNSSYAVKEVALAAGYPDVYAFSKQFKKHVGMPPSTFRDHALL